MSVQLNFNTRNFSRAIEKYAENSTRSMEEILTQQAKLVVRNVIELTPPGKSGVKGSAAKKIGEKSVSSDLNRLFIPVPKSRAVASDLGAIHARQRNNRGRVPRRVGVRHKVWKTDFNRYLVQQTKKVGALAGGWNEAAAKLGWRAPAWIARHNSPGSAAVTVTDKSVRVSASNEVPYASNVTGLDRRVRMAVEMQESNLLRQVADYMKKRRKL